MNIQWTPEQETKLLKDYKMRGGGGISDFVRDQLPMYPDRTYAALRMKLTELLQFDGFRSVPDSAYPDWDMAPELIGDALIMGDMHIPYHNAAHVNRCMLAARSLGVRRLILAGDALDMRAFSHWPEDFEDSEKIVASNNLRKELTTLAAGVDPVVAEAIYSLLDKTQPELGNIGDEIRTARDIFSIMDESFDEVLYVMGNHETWVTKAIKKTISNADFARLFIGDMPRWKVTPYYWCRLISGGEPFQIEHPKNSGKGSSKKMAPIFNCNIIMLHNHHFSVQTDPSGRWLAIEPGMCADDSKIQYDNQRHGTHDKHITGAVLVKDGKVHFLNQFTDWSLYLRHGYPKN